ncbi:hypothetical protein ILYODFUR_026058 [Ilyodon furcidens]|uniref:Cytochrome P450 2J2-like n=1 Tax=Ilyodon furcidens TaxID=33524 RepID=A0ABV0U975_9TELE
MPPRSSGVEVSRCSSFPSTWRSIALQCLSVNLCGNFKSWFQIPATFSSGSKSSVWIMPQPKYSSLRRNPSDASSGRSLILAALKLPSPGKRTLLTLHHLLHQILTSNVYSVLPGSASFFHSNHHSLNLLCLQSRFQFHITTCQNKLAKLFSCLLSVILHVGVIFSNGNIWKQQRRFALSTLKYLGFGKKSLEPVILDEFRHCAQEFRGYKGKPMNPHLIINNTVSNIICHLVFGHRFEYGDERFIKLMLLFGKALEIESSIWSQLYNSFPLLMRLLPGPHQTLKQIWNDVKTFIKEELNQHKKNWDPAECRDYIDCYLQEIQTNKEQEYNTFDEENLIMCVLDLFVAGSETTSNTLRWAFLYMAKYPEIQEKVQAEIDRVIGQSEQPSMEDRVNLPYTDAVIHEVLRMGNIAPLALPHSTNKEVQLGGYTIPTGVLIIPNLASVLFDKKEWGTPLTFNPGHFLNEEGKFAKKAAFIPFSAGKRLCLGENLARMELFLFFTSFMKHFTFSMPAGVKAVMDYHVGITLAPKPYEICIKSR